jgi:hypothetical protein
VRFVNAPTARRFCDGCRDVSVQGRIVRMRQAAFGDGPVLDCYIVLQGSLTLSSAVTEVHMTRAAERQSDASK